MTPLSATPAVPLVPQTRATLVADLEAALARVSATRVDPVDTDGSDALSDALEACQAQIKTLTPDAAPLRCLHHFACSGGTLISKAVAALPNVQLHSEIDPFSTLSHDAGRNPFHPGDLIADLYFDPRRTRDRARETVADVFLAGLEALRRAEQRQGRYLVLRDHTHSQFCAQSDPGSRPTLRGFLQDHMPVLSVVTVRHPLDCFLSLRKNNWVYFAPATIDEYCRRHLAFLDAYTDVAIYRYEDFVADPQDIVARIAADLQLPFAAGFEELLALFDLSGDSGRKGSPITTRPRRAVPEPIALEAQESASYKELCLRLNYQPNISSTTL